MTIRDLKQLEKFCADYRKELENNLINSLLQIQSTKDIELIREKGLPDVILVNPDIFEKAKKIMGAYAIIEKSSQLSGKTHMILRWKQNNNTTRQKKG